MKRKLLRELPRYVGIESEVHKGLFLSQIYRTKMERSFDIRTHFFNGLSNIDTRFHIPLRRYDEKTWASMNRKVPEKHCHGKALCGDIVEHT